MSERSASDSLHLGLDIGAVNVHEVVVDGAGSVVLLDVERTLKGSFVAVKALRGRLKERGVLDDIASAGVTGSGRHIYDGQDGWQLFTSPYAAIVGVLSDGYDPRTIISIGGQSALVIGLEGGLNKPWRVARSPLCAAGTGRFLEQQASRLGILIEDFGRYALKWDQPPPRIAARCSVFAKSDLIHLQQKGWPIAAMLAGLSSSIAQMIESQWRDSFEPPICVIGGVAANQGVIYALAQALNQPIDVLTNHAHREAIGAALLSRGKQERPRKFFPANKGGDEIHYITRTLDPVAITNNWSPVELKSGKIEKVYLGVDVGSTSTKAAVVSPNGEVLAKTYLMTAGQPLEAVKKAMANLVPMVEGKVRVVAAGVTGSGRYLVGNFIGADLIKNEITAQTTAAIYIDPNVNTVFELGGQDAKYVYLENGTVLDYQMNKACAAGTGSFIDELAEQLEVSTRDGQFARLAFAATRQIDLGEKCTAFMSQAVTSAQHAGIPLEIIVSSLATSLARNYLSKVVGGRRVGDRIFLTGAVFYNEAAVAAFQKELPKKTFIVPEHKEVTGAIGAAFLAGKAISGGAQSAFKGFSRLAAEGYKLTHFNCGKCENSCDISVMTTDKGQKLFYGSRCDLYDAGSTSKNGKAVTPFTIRGSLLLGESVAGEVEYA